MGDPRVSVDNHYLGAPRVHEWGGGEESVNMYLGDSMVLYGASMIV